MRKTAAYRTSYGVDLPYRSWTTPDIIFKVIAVDGSGQLSIDELRQFFKHSPLDNVKVEELLGKIDTDGNGEISCDEWRKCFHAAGFDGSGVVGQSSEGFGMLLSLVKPNFAVTTKMAELHCGRAPLNIVQPEMRGITLTMLRQLWSHVNERCIQEGWMDVHGELLEPTSINMYELQRYVIKPCTLSCDCSYVERCSEFTIQPSWTVVHWWGDSFHDLLLCLERHSRDRGVSEDGASYWIAAFALNQHDESPVEMSDPARFAMPRAVALSIGTLVAVDRCGVVFRRLWILYELYLAIYVRQPGRPPKLLDLYAPHPHLSKRRLPKPPVPTYAVGLTDGVTMIDRGLGPTCRHAVRPHGVGQAANKTEREAYFPIELFFQALSLNVDDAHTSIEHDKRAILGHMDKTSVAPETLAAAVRGRVAVAALRRAFDTGGTLLTTCLFALSASMLTHLSADLSGCVDFDVYLAKNLADALPPTVESLTLHFSNVPSAAADARVKGLAAHMASPTPRGEYCGKLPNLTSLTLVSNSLTTEGTSALGLACCAPRAPPKLRSLDMGLPAPFDHRMASALLAERSTKWLSYFGEGRMMSTGELDNGVAVSLPNKGLTSSDLLLLLATVARSCPTPLTSLVMTGNDLDEIGVAQLAEMITSGLLPKLAYINLSGNERIPESGRKGVLQAMRSFQGPRLDCDFELESLDGFSIVPKAKSNEG